MVLFLAPISTNSIFRLLCPLEKSILKGRSALVFSISKNGVVTIYLNAVLLGRTFLKLRLNQSKNIKLVEASLQNLLNVDIVAWMLRLGKNVCLDYSLTF